MSWLQTSNRRRPGLAARWRDLAYWLPIVVVAILFWTTVAAVGWIVWEVFR